MLIHIIIKIKMKKHILDLKSKLEFIEESLQEVRLKQNKGKMNKICNSYYRRE
jgi:hypothetical protein